MWAHTAKITKRPIRLLELHLSHRDNLDTCNQLVQLAVAVHSSIIITVRMSAYASKSGQAKVHHVTTLFQLVSAMQTIVLSRYLLGLRTATPHCPSFQAASCAQKSVCDPNRHPYHPVAIIDDLLSDMASAWPRLRKLELDVTSPLRKPHSHGDRRSQNTTRTPTPRGGVACGCPHDPRVPTQRPSHTRRRRARRALFPSVMVDCKWADFNDEDDLDTLLVIGKRCRLSEVEHSRHGCAENPEGQAAWQEHRIQAGIPGGVPVA